MRYRIIALSHLQRQPFNKVCNERKSALSRDKIAVIIPCYNEALTIGKVIDDFRRDRPEGSVSKLNTVRDGLKVIAMIGTLFKDYRPLKFFSLVALAFCIGGLCAGMPVVSEYLATGLVPRLPTAILAVAFMFIAALSLATGFILDAVAKVERKQWELHVYRQAENE